MMGSELLIGAAVGVVVIAALATVPLWSAPKCPRCRLQLAEARSTECDCPFAKDDDDAH